MIRFELNYDDDDTYYKCIKRKETYIADRVSSTCILKFFNK